MHGAADEAIGFVREVVARACSSLPKNNRFMSEHCGNNAGRLRARKDKPCLKTFRHLVWRRWVCISAESVIMDFSPFGLGKRSGQAAEGLGRIQAPQ
jgi:hypothetical protein